VKKNLKKSVALVLLITMFFAANQPVLAMEHINNSLSSREPVTITSEDGKTVTTTFVKNGNIFIIEFFDTGYSTIMHEYHNGILMQEGVVYHGVPDRLYLKSFNHDNLMGGYEFEIIEFTDIQTSEWLEIERGLNFESFLNEEANQLPSTRWFRRGSVVFRSGLFLANTHIAHIYEWAFSAFDRAQHTIRNQWTTSIQLASHLSFVLGVPLFKLHPIAAFSAWVFGGVVHVAGFLITEATYFAHRFFVEYRFVDASNPSRVGIVTTRRYVITYEGTPHFQEIYWPAFSNSPMFSPMGNHNFGTLIFNMIFRSQVPLMDSWVISAWN
jgi:hypothetical protein